MLIFYTTALINFNVIRVINAFLSKLKLSVSYIILNINQFFGYENDLKIFNIRKKILSKNTHVLIKSIV